MGSIGKILSPATADFALGSLPNPAFPACAGVAGFARAAKGGSAFRDNPGQAHGSAGPYESEKAATRGEGGAERFVSIEKRSETESGSAGSRAEGMK